MRAQCPRHYNQTEGYPSKADPRILDLWCLVCGWTGSARDQSAIGTGPTYELAMEAALDRYRLDTEELGLEHEKGTFEIRYHRIRAVPPRLSVTHEVMVVMTRRIG